MFAFYLSVIAGLFSTFLGWLVTFLWKRHRERVSQSTELFRARDAFSRKSKFLIPLGGIVVGLALWGFLAASEDPGSAVTQQDPLPSSTATEAAFDSLNDSDCLRTDIPSLRESRFIVTDAALEVVDCDRPHSLFVTTDSFCGDDTTFRRVGAPNFQTRLVTGEYEDVNTGLSKCLIGLNDAGTLQDLTWRLDDLRDDLRWAALQIGACVAPDAKDFITSAREPLSCVPGLALVFKVQVEGAQTADDLQFLTDTVCGSLASDVGSSNWRSQWVSVNPDGRPTDYWCAAVL